MGVVDLSTLTLSMVWHENCHEAPEGTYVPITTAYEGYSYIWCINLLVFRSLGTYNLK